MKILYGITKSNFGGAQRYVYDLATEAKKSGHEVAVVCGGRGALTEKLEQENIKVITLENLQRDISLMKEIKSFVQILKILKNERPDVFHTNSSKIGGMGAVAARYAGIKKIIFTSHGWAFNESWRPVWQRAAIKFFHWLTIIVNHKTICVSRKTKNQISSWPFIGNKLVIIHNGIMKFDLLARAKAREKLGVKSGDFVVGSLSELHKIKGLDLLLTAWSKFIKHHEAKLILMGTGEERENLQNMAQQMGISESVVFRGFIDNARTLLTALDVFVMPSLSENLPYAILEAGIAELPVVATYVGGIPEIINTGTSGVLVPAEDSEAILSSLILLVEDNELRMRLGKELKTVVEKNFSLEKMVRDTLNVYAL